MSSLWLFRKECVVRMPKLLKTTTILFTELRSKIYERLTIRALQGYS